MVRLKTLAFQYSWHDRKSFRTLRTYDHPNIKECECKLAKELKEDKRNWKGIIMIDEGGEIKVKEERDLTNPPTLSGPGQTMTTDSYLHSFAEFINSENPKELLQILFCEIPERMFLDLNADEQLDFIHKLDSCVKIIKVYQQSAEVNHRNKVESLDLEERVKLKKKDQEYKVKPSAEEMARKDQKTKQQKLVDTLRAAGLSEEAIVKIVHGDSK